MYPLRRLLKVGTVADSMGVYLPAMVLQKALGLGRVLIFTYLMKEARAQYGLWGLGMMLFTLAAPLMTLGSEHGLVRYVSYYESRRQLQAFYHRLRRKVLLCAVVIAAAAMLAAPALARLLVKYRSEAAGATSVQVLWICLGAAANAFVLSLHSNMISFMVGMRAYRLASLIELFFSALFTVLGVAVLLVTPSSLAVLLAHLAASSGSLVAGMIMLHVGITRLLREDRAAVEQALQDKTLLGGPRSETEEITAATVRAVWPQPPEAEARPAGVFRRILKFGLVAMAGNFLWLSAQYVSFFITYLRCGEAPAGVFLPFLQLSQPTLFLANAAWAVIFTHVARRWETDRKPTAMFVLETSYKAIAMVMMTLTVVIYATARWWVLMLHESYRPGLPLLGGLLTFFQVVIHLAIMTIVAKLHERPFVIALAAVAGGAGSAVLAVLWTRPGELVPQGAAWAAGVGMFAGAGAVTVIYLLCARVRLQASTWFILVSPAILLATRWISTWALAAVWAAVCAAAIFTPAMFSARQKHFISASVKRMFALSRRIFGRC